MRSLRRLPELAGVIWETPLDVRVLLQTKMEELANPLLRLRASGRCDKPVPLSANFLIRRQARNIDHLLDVHDCLLVERGDATGKRVDELIQLGIRKGTID